MSKVLKFSDFEEIFDYRIIHENSEHSSLYLKTRIKEDNFSNTDDLIGKVIKADVFEEGYDEEITKHVKNVFLGVIDKVQIDFADNAYCEIEAHSFSKLLDSEKKYRIFQNPKKTLLDILKAVSKYDGIVLKGEGTESISVPDPIIQYDETDWQFMLRICRQFGCKVSISHDFNSEKEGTIWIGEINRKPIEIQFGQIFSKVYECATSYIVFQDENIYEVGDVVSINNKNYSIRSCDFYMKNHSLIREYKISDCIDNEIRSLNLEGTVISSEVVALEGDGKNKGQIQVKFDWEEYTPEEMIWIDWSTSYCDDSVGIYNMPAIGEKVLVTVLDSNGTKLVAHSCIRKTEIDQEIKVTDKILKVGDREIRINDDAIFVKNQNATVTIEKDKLSIETADGNWKLTNGKSTIATDGENIKIDCAKVEIDGTDVKIRGSQEVTILGNKTIIESPAIELKGMVEVK